MKKHIKNALGNNGVRVLLSIVNRILLIMNYKQDMYLYSKYSLCFNRKEYENKEADLILNYHSIEKGLLFKNTKPRFAQNRIINLHRTLRDKDVLYNIKKSQVEVGYKVICEYYELHQKLNIDISDFYTEKDYFFYKKHLGENYNKSFTGSIDLSKEVFYKNNEKDFYYFSHSRKSVRDFTGEKISIDRIKSAVKLAKNAPSVCNRQASNVYFIEDKHKIDKILAIQGGFTGYIHNVSQLLILTNDRKYYYTVGERYQFYIDGGIFLMNLLYSLHFYKIANCPANWGKTFKDEKSLKSIINLPESEKIICMIPIGEAFDNFKVTLSQRRNIEELFFEL